MAFISKESLQQSIQAILKDADLDSLSARKVRKMLETEYKVDFSERKEEIDNLVMTLITNEEELKNGHKESLLSDGFDDDEDDDVPRKKAKTTSASKGKKVNDEELAQKLQDEEFDSRPSRRCKSQTTKVKRKEPAQKPRQKGTSLYSRPCALLPPLSNVLGTDRMPRPEVVKRFWAIAKERNLLDPSNKQFMLCEGEMFDLFGKKKIKLFGMMKHLKAYIKDLPQE